jgi:hypothetical protein
MLLAYMHGRATQSERQELCLIPDKPDSLSYPVPIASLEETSAAVYRIGQGESFIVRTDPSDRSLIIEALKPAHVYLTLDRPDQPGFHVQRVKVTKSSGGFLIRYQRDSQRDKAPGESAPWTNWEPLAANLQ